MAEVMSKGSSLDLNVHSDEVSLSEEELDYVKQKTLENELDFFDAFGKIPELDEVSLDLTDDLSKQMSNDLGSGSSDSTDLGKYHDPLNTASPLLSTQSVKSMQEDFPSSKNFEMEESEDEDQQLQSHIDDISEDVLTDDIVEPVDTFQDAKLSVKIEEDAFELFLEVAKEEEIQTEDKIDKVEAALEREKQERVIQTNVTDFLNKLIDRCIAAAEYSDSNKILRTFLDKKKLVNELKPKYDSLEQERKVSQFLNKKIVEYFKRKNSFRMISADDPNTSTLYHNNFYSALNALDNWLNREEKTKAFLSSQLLDLKNQFDNTQQQFNKEVDNFEQLVKSTFQAKGIEKSQTWVDKYLDQMSALRKEISQVRLTLLLRQHQFSSLKEQMETLEDLGNGLNARQFESLETETTAISKKIEENSSSLKRFHNRFHEDLHKIAHLREKQKMVRNMITAQHQYLDELINQKKELREYINKHKLKHSCCRHEIRELNSQSGLLFKPVLIKDYDKMAETTTKLHQTNEELRKTINELNIKIAILEKNSMV